MLTEEEKDYWLNKLMESDEDELAEEISQLSQTDKDKAEEIGNFLISIFNGGGKIL